MRTQFVEDALNTIAGSGLIHNDKGVRLDAGEAVFLERQLEHVEARLYQVKYRELKYRRLIPVSNEGEGSANIVYYIYSKIGMAKIIANPTDDLPSSDVYGERFSAKVHVCGTSFNFSTQELRNAQFANVPLDSMKGDSARRSIQQQENEIAWNGNSEHGILGFLNNPNVPQDEVQVAAGGGGSRVWGVDKTAVEVAEDIASLQTNIETDTNQVHSGSDLILPINKYRYLATTPMSETMPTMTILKWILDPMNGFGIRNVEGVKEMTGAGVGGTDAMMLYEKEPDVIQLRIPMEMRPLPPQPRNLSFKIPVESEIAGVVIRYPLACRMGYGI